MKRAATYFLAALVPVAAATIAVAAPYSDEQAMQLPEMTQLMEQIGFQRGEMLDTERNVAAWERAGYILGQQAQHLGNDLERNRRFSAMRDALERNAAMLDFLFGLGGRSTAAFERGLIGATQTLDNFVATPVFEPLPTAPAMPAGGTPATPVAVAELPNFDGTYLFRGNYGPVEQSIDVEVRGTSIKLRVMNAYGVEGKVFDYMLTGGRFEPADSPDAFRHMVGYEIKGAAYDRFGNATLVDGGDWRFAQLAPNIFELGWRVNAGDFGGYVRFGTEEWSHGATEAASSIFR